jgi:hypothetical protein
MSDNACAYRKSRAFRAVLDRHGARHILTPPYTPRCGKVERFIQTPKRGWTYGNWPDSAELFRAMASILRYYNRRHADAHWEIGRRSAAFTTSVGRAASWLSTNFSDYAS